MVFNESLCVCKLCGGLLRAQYISDTPVLFSTNANNVVYAHSRGERVEADRRQLSIERNGKVQGSARAVTSFS